MSEITNPPLEPVPAEPSSAANRHTSGPIVNPPLEGGRASARSELRNPPLGGTTSVDDVEVAGNPDLTSGGLNPPPDETDIERWFEQQLMEQASSKDAPTKRAPSKRRAAKKRAAKRSSSQKAPAKKPTKKKATRRRTTSK